MTDEPGESRRSPSSSPVRVLVVDDDPAMQRMITTFLQDNNVLTAGAFTMQETVHQLATREFSLVILDLRLGTEDGLDLLRQIRARSDVPVIIITGHRRDEIDRVVGLELGADDYLLKPFGLRELLARIRAVLRRQEAVKTVSVRATPPDTLKFGDWVLEPRSQKLLNPSGAVIELTKGEFALLMAFLAAPQRTLSREHLLQATRIHEDVFDRSIDVQILRLRRKLEIDTAAPQIIQTKRGAGYMFTLPVESV